MGRAGTSPAGDRFVPRAGPRTSRSLLPVWWQQVVARRRARQWAATLLRSEGWVVLDTETSGVNRDAEVVQVAVVHPSGTTLFDACVRPVGPVPAAAAAIHGLRDDVLSA